MVVNDALVRQYEQAPISYDPITGTVNYSAERGLYRDAFVEIKNLTKKDFGGDASRVPNTSSYYIASQLAFDVRFSDYATLNITGDFDFSYGPNTSLSPLNMPRCANNVSRTINWDVMIDFTQRFPDEEASADNTEGSSTSGKAIKNVMYNISAMFNRQRSNTYNEVFGSSLDDVFKYGYIGRLETEQRPNFELNPSFNYNGVSRAAMVQNSWYDVIDWSTYEPYEGNQILANYNLQLLGIPDISGMLTNIDNLRYFKGLANGDSPADIYGLLANVGVQDGSFGFQQNDFIYLTAKASASIKDHAIEIGFQYDRSDQSYFALSSNGLWTIMRQNANRHISQMDLSKPNYRWVGSTLYVEYDRLLNREGQSYFDRAMRDYLGWSGNDKLEVTYLDVDRYTPEDYVKAGGLGMFSADELFNNGSRLVNYYGYDHTGKKFNSSNWSLKDYFSPSDPKYRYAPAYTPTYMAGYIQDQFYFSDLIFNVGVRVDIFDANQSVLKDPYLLYESYTVKDLKDGKAPYQVELSGKDSRLGTAVNPISVLGRFYIGVYASDQSDGSTPNNGYDRIDIWVDGRPFFQYKMDVITYSETRAINAQLDYDYYLATRRPYILTRRLEGDPVRPARTYGDGSVGFISSDTMLHRITVAVSDFNGNRSVRSFYVRNSLETLVPMHDVPEHPSYHLFTDSLTVRWPVSVSRGDYQIDMPAGMVYYNDLLVHGIQKDRRYISPIYTVKPWQSPYPPHRTWQLRVPLVVGYEPEQLVLCKLKDDKLSAQPTRVVERKVEGKPGRWLEADVRDFGNFVVANDVTPPTIKPLNFKAGGKVSARVLRMKMSDDLSGVREYRCFINGEWVLAEFDGKYATLSIDLNQIDKNVSSLDLRIFLTDCCGNETELSYNLKR